MLFVGGSALADKLGIPKAVMYVPGVLSPLAGHTFGSGASLRATVPQWMTLLPRNMVSVESLCVNAMRCSRLCTSLS